MFFLANLYERRLNENMRRHVLTAKLAPTKPKVPKSAQSSRRSSAIPSEKGADGLILQRYLEVYAKTAPPSPPPAYKEAKTETLAVESRTRAGSIESAFFTDSDSSIGSA